MYSGPHSVESQLLQGQPDTDQSLEPSHSTLNVIINGDHQWHANNTPHNIFQLLFPHKCMYIFVFCPHNAIIREFFLCAFGLRFLFALCVCPPSESLPILCRSQPASSEKMAGEAHWIESNIVLFTKEHNQENAKYFNIQSQNNDNGSIAALCWNRYHNSHCCGLIEISMQHTHYDGGFGID